MLISSVIQEPLFLNFQDGLRASCSPSNPSGLWCQPGAAEAQPPELSNYFGSQPFRCDRDCFSRRNRVIQSSKATPKLPLWLLTSGEIMQHSRINLPPANYKIRRLGLRYEPMPTGGGRPPPLTVEKGEFPKTLLREGKPREQLTTQQWLSPPTSLKQ